jgi:hypothetical protein
MRDALREAYAQSFGAGMSNDVLAGALPSASRVDVDANPNPPAAAPMASGIVVEPPPMSATLAASSATPQPIQLATLSAENLSARATATPAGLPKRRGFVLPVAIAGAIVAIAVGGFAIKSALTQNASPTPPSSAAAQATTTTSAPPATSISDALTIAPSTERSTTPASADANARDASTPVATSLTTRPMTPPTTPTTPPTVIKPACVPGFYLGPDGQKHYQTCP